MKKQILTILMMSMVVFSFAETYKGTVKDPQNKAVPFANVVLFSLPDSTFVEGTTTDDLGKFLLKSEQEVTKGYLEISCIGYETQTVPAKEQLGNIILKEATNELGEVVVKASRPTFKMDAKGIATKVENTLLSTLGTANDVLAQLPFVNEDNGKISVFGRGKPLIYLNNRLLRNTNELQQLNSKSIKDVKVILNPGAEYDATVSSVIRITTKKAVGEGLSGSVYSYVKQTRKTDVFGRVKLNYRKGNLDIFGGGYLGLWKAKTYQTDEIRIATNNDLHIVQQDIFEKNDDREYSANAGINYDISKNHSVGVKYEYTHCPHYENWAGGTSTHLLNGVQDATLLMDIFYKEKTKKHYINGYYHGKLSDKAQLHLDGDWVKGNGSSPQESVNNQSDNTTTVKSENKNDYTLYAGKLWLSYKLWKGKALVGAESSYTENNQSYEMLTPDIAQNLPSNKNSSNQSLVAPFISYNFSLKKFAIEIGLRYEHINFNYFLNDVKSEEQSKTYNNLSPNFSIAYRNKVNMSLSYRKTVRRPSYRQLRSSISYYDPYSYEGGNPALQPAFINKLTYLFGWKNIQAMMSYSWYEDQVVFMAKQFEDKPIILFTNENVKHSKVLDGGIAYSPKISFWRPTFTAGFQKQYLTVDNTDFNKIGLYAQWKNMFKLPNNFVITFNMKGNTGGHRGLMEHKNFFNADLTFSKQFFNKALNVSLAFSDIFNTNRTEWETQLGNVAFEKWNSTDIRAVKFQITYNFNATRGKYKGKKATDEMQRL